MAYTVNYNYGSFSFTDFNHFLLALLISLLHPPPLSALPVSTLREMLISDRKRSALAFNTGVSTYLKISAPYPVLTEIQQRKIVKTHYAHRDDNPDITQDIIEKINSAIAAFNAVSTFPVVEGDFTELYRLLNDLAVPQISYAFTATAKIRESMREFAREWNASMPATLFFSENLTTRLPVSILRTPVATVEIDKSDSGSSNGVKKPVATAEVEFKAPLFDVGPSVTYDKMKPEFQASYDKKFPPKLNS